MQITTRLTLTLTVGCYAVKDIHGAFIAINIPSYREADKVCDFGDGVEVVEQTEAFCDQ